jgi:hypothetical protein
MQRAALQRAETTRRNGNLACNRQHGTMRKRQDLIPDATDSKIGCNGQHCTMQQAEPTTCNVATWHHAKKTGFPIPDATDNKIGCNGQHFDMQQAEPTTCNGQHGIMRKR